MPLVTCPDCSKDISDRASACIHCGCPLESSSSNGSVPTVAPSADTSVATNDPNDSAKEFYNRDGVRITRTIFYVAGVEYQIRNINVVNLTKQRPGLGVGVAMVLVFGFFALVAFGMGAHGWGLLWLILVAFGIAMIMAGPEYQVVLNTSSGLVTSFKTRDQNTAEEVRQALGQAMSQLA